MSKNTHNSIELLAPARDTAVGVEAIKHGADAVYIGAADFGARAEAGNSIKDISVLADFAHRYNARVYATVNTIIYDEELKRVEKLIHDLYKAGVDALIIQDLGILRLDIPPISLHSSTQCDLRTPDKAQFLESLGFSQLVLARELSLDEIKSIKAKVKVPLEAFCHGALCVSYSGRCQISQMLKGRSANRGRCAQLCRTSWDLVDGEGMVLLRQKHLLSLKDFNAANQLAQMIDSGVSSFKIEGRLKDVTYVKNAVAYYRTLLDGIISSRDDLSRASSGMTELFFTPSPEKSFNRSFTSYFLNSRHPENALSMASIETPKSLGEQIGTVKSAKGKQIILNVKKDVANGDGLSYFDKNGVFTGFRVNKVEGEKIICRESLPISAGTLIYRTHDKTFNDILTKESAKRVVRVDANLKFINNRLYLKLSDERGNSITHSVECGKLPEADTPQGERQRAVLSKLGNTIYKMRALEVIENLFIPASLLTQLRREAIEMLDRSNVICRTVELRRSENKSVNYPDVELSSSDNVANRLAGQLYAERGVTQIQPALEVQPAVDDRPVMTTRYCLRRELGACLKDTDCAKNLPAKLFLKQGNTLVEVRCHCKSCEMTLHIVNS